jgi:hypothetical protein
MKRKTRQNERARQIVTDRLRAFAAALHDKLAGETDAFWKKVEDLWKKMQADGTERS